LRRLIKYQKNLFFGRRVIYWTGSQDETFTGDNEKRISGHVPTGSTFEDYAHPGHTFRVYDFYRPEVYADYHVEGKYGDHHHVHIEL
jgi:hypothetical protein